MNHLELSEEEWSAVLAIGAVVATSTLFAGDLRGFSRFLTAGIAAVLASGTAAGVLAVRRRR